ncbi:MAG: hypothetical protein L0338_35025 [Acidobacteria bacterium]|nr:hypothetical protein [Acidobacteriota bacterium]
MRWKIICQIGNDDDFSPSIASGVPRLSLSLDKKDGECPTASSVMEDIKAAGLRLSDKASDLVYLAETVYSADLRVPRGLTDDCWTRDFEIHLPVAEPKTWEEAKPTLVRMLSFLTGDNWTFRFRRRRTATGHSGDSAGRKLFQSVSLFSGGLDSFIGAIDLLENGETIALVGQHGKGSAKKEQERAYEVITNNYKDRTFPFWFYVQPYIGKDRESENTMRSRSILFLALGTAVASTVGRGTKLYVPENGLISLNVPLTFSRLGSLSTRTTHPHFISLYRNLLDEIGIAVKVETPYRFKTKGEMLNECRNQTVLLQGAQATMSCAHPSAGRYQSLPVGKHCGYCVPCLIRRAAMKAAGMDDSDDYNFDILAKEPSPDTALGRDVRAFGMAIERTRSMSHLQLVAEVLGAGPVPPEEIGELMAVYQRGLDEVGRFLASFIAG